MAKTRAAGLFEAIYRFPLHGPDKARAYVLPPLAEFRHPQAGDRLNNGSPLLTLHYTSQYAATQFLSLSGDAKRCRGYSIKTLTDDSQHPALLGRHHTFGLIRTCYWGTPDLAEEELRLSRDPRAKFLGETACAQRAEVRLWSGSVRGREGRCAGRARHWNMAISNALSNPSNG